MIKGEVGFLKYMKTYNRKSLFFHHVQYSLSPLPGSPSLGSSDSDFFRINKRDAFIFLYTLLVGDDRNCEVGSSVTEWGQPD